MPDPASTSRVLDRLTDLIPELARVLIDHAAKKPVIAKWKAARNLTGNW